MIDWPERTSLRFIAVGVVNTLVGLLVIYGAKWLLRIGDVAANAAGYGIGLVLSFLLNKSWTFRFSGSSAAAAVRFFAAFLLAYFVNLLTVLMCIRLLGINDYLAHAIAIVPYTVTFYALSKWFVFREKRTGP